MSDTRTQTTGQAVAESLIYTDAAGTYLCGPGGAPLALSSRPLSAPGLAVARGMIAAAVDGAVGERQGREACVCDRDEQ